MYYNNIIHANEHSAVTIQTSLATLLFVFICKTISHIIIAQLENKFQVRS